jgi:hypothetical protein
MNYFNITIAASTFSVRDLTVSIGNPTINVSHTTVSIILFIFAMSLLITAINPSTLKLKQNAKNNQR